MIGYFGRLARQSGMLTGNETRQATPMATTAATGLASVEETQSDVPEALPTHPPALPDPIPQDSLMAGQRSSGLAKRPESEALPRLPTHDLKDRVVHSRSMDTPKDAAEPAGPTSVRTQLVPQASPGQRHDVTPPPAISLLSEKVDPGREEMPSEQSGRSARLDLAPLSWPEVMQQARRWVAATPASDETITDSPDQVALPPARYETPLSRPGVAPPPDPVRGAESRELNLSIGTIQVTIDQPRHPTPPLVQPMSRAVGEHERFRLSRYYLRIR